MRRSVSRVAVWLVVACLVVSGCGEVAPGDERGVPDGEHEVAIPGGKADRIWSRCEIDRVLLWLNDAGTERSTLTAAGVHGRAAGHIIDHRNGPDAVYPSGDDRGFDALGGVDEVPWVGSVAMDQLTAGAPGDCARQRYRQAAVWFSPADYETSHLARTRAVIEGATRSIDVAMYSFYHDPLVDALADAASRGVEIRIIYDKTRRERDDGPETVSAGLEDIGADVRWVNRVMHHKFVIVDGVRSALFQATDASVVTGSANWTYGAATKYDENTVFVRGYPEVALRFQREFNRMWRYSRPYGRDDVPRADETMALRAEMIPDAGATDAAFTSRNFRAYFSPRWGPTFGVKDSPATVANRIIRELRGADESIRVASAHLRSRPVAETILQLHRNRPDLDIRVYLDGQEHITEADHREQLAELERCVSGAADEEERRDCRRSGFYFSYALHESGVPTRFKYNAYRWHFSYAEQMHHKYIIIDDERVISGSYNLSNNAEFNSLENIVIYRRRAFPELVDRFESNFRRLWRTGRPGRYAQLQREIRHATESIPIVFDAMALDHGEIAGLESLIESRCPAVTSEDFESDPRNHETCSVR